MRLAVRLFAAAAEAVGAREVVLDLRDGSSAADCLAALAASCSLPLPPCVVAVDRQVVPATFVLRPGSEVAILPPVSGGGQVLGVGPEPLHLDGLLAAVALADHGGTVLFVGTVRGQTGTHATRALEYEAYGEMATLVLERIAAEAARHWPGVRVAMRHRTGTLPPGAAAVAVAASAPHRGDAFAAARFCIERLKADLPVWKRDHGPGGEARWVDHP